MAVSVVENTTTYNENFLLLQNSIVDIGKANGVIINAITSVGVPDVTVKLRSNWNNKNGRVEYTTTTNENGFYEILLL